MLALTLGLVGSTMAASPPDGQAEAETIRATERERVRALVDADMDVARRLHASDFQLINPVGESFSRDEYLAGVASGRVDYLLWKPEAIEVRYYGSAAVIRYRSELEVAVDGTKVPRRRHWHTDSYEKRDGRWQIVWSQATAIR
jgi:hypothetical protein